MDAVIAMFGYVVTVTSLACFVVYKPSLKAHSDLQCPATGAEGSVVLVTGGAGYVGSHTVLELLSADYTVVVVDNLVNAIPGYTKPVSLARVEQLTGKTVSFHDIDLRNKKQLSSVFKQYNVSSVVHFAALKAVGESVQRPLDYYNNNIGGTITLLEVMNACGVRRLVFSSSATVYGAPTKLPISEQHPIGVGITNPYGRTKFFIEQILEDMVVSDPSWQVTLLRYFNPVGAHASGDIGEDPRGEPNNLMPYISQVAVGRRPHLNVYGSNYDTIDGTGVRDYIHVVDLALGHMAALANMRAGCHVFNLGTGQGHSVLEVVAAFERVSGRRIPLKMVEPRAGDLAAVYADCARARTQLGWQATHTLDQMVASAWHWQRKNRHGYATPPSNNGATTCKHE